MPGIQAAHPSIEHHGKHMATKKAATKKSAPKAAAKPAVQKPIKEALSKSGLVAHICRKPAAWWPRTCAPCMAALEGAVAASLSKKGAGSFTLPGLLKISADQRAGQAEAQGHQPFTKEEQWFAAKPATIKVKVRPLKKLKDAAA